jgi:outer membrane protein, heavy metal efflux system
MHVGACRAQGAAVRRGRSRCAGRLVALASLVLLVPASCRRFQPVPLSAVDTATALESRRLDDPGLHDFLARIDPAETTTWPRASWDLRALTLAALYYHPDLAVARAQWRVAQAGVATAGSRPNPSVSVTPQYVANAPGSAVPWVVTAALDWPVETAGKRGRRIERAQHLAASARFGLDAAAWTVRAGVRARLVDLIAARGQATLLERGYAAQRELTSLLDERARAGAVSLAEVAPARVAELQAAADLAAAKRREAEARVALATAVGVPVRALDGVEVAFSIDARPPGLGRPPAVLRREALHGRSDVLAALAMYAATQSALQLEIARQYPDVRIGPGYEYDQGLNKWAVVGVSVELPVLNRNQGPIGEAEAQRTETAARFQALQATVIDGLDRALAGRDAAERSMVEADRLLVAERQRLRLAQEAFAAGASDRLVLSAAAASAITAERLHLDAQVTLQQALGDLEAVVQPPLEVEPVVVEEGAP